MKNHFRFRRNFLLLFSTFQLNWKLFDIYRTFFRGLGKNLFFLECTIVSKAQEYMMTTNAYEEITTGYCPLAENFNAVMKLLNHLLKQRVITQKQFEKLCPKTTDLELAHFHCLPKVHKVRFVSFYYPNTLLYFIFLIAWNTNSTYYCWNSCTSNVTFEIFK